MAAPKTAPSASGSTPALDITDRPVALRTLDLATFFQPKTVAVVGASDAGTKPNTALTQKITTWSEERGATVYYVNPNRDDIGGRPCAKALTDITEPLDLVAILVGDPLPILHDAVAAKAKFAIVFAAGFAEVGAGGREDSGGDGTGHRRWRDPRSGPEHQPQCLRGVPRRPAR